MTLGFQCGLRVKYRIKLGRARNSLNPSLCLITVAGETYHTLSLGQMKYISQNLTISKSS